MLPSRQRPPISKGRRKDVRRSRARAEADRVKAENGRLYAEKVRSAAERDRQASEALRKAAEDARQSAEIARFSAEVARKAADEIRRMLDQGRQIAEELRRKAEEARGSAERIRRAEAAGLQSAIRQGTPPGPTLRTTLATGAPAEIPETGSTPIPPLKASSESLALPAGTMSAARNSPNVQIFIVPPCKTEEAARRTLRRIRSQAIRPRRRSAGTARLLGA